MNKKFLLYAIRWQVAGIVYPAPIYFAGPVWGTIIGSLIGAVAFFWTDRYLTRK